MYRKSLFTKNYIVKLFLLVSLVTVFCISPVAVQAQSKTKANKLKTKKATRVFYGQASYYANKFEGRRTANGEIFRQKQLTCACNVLPLGTWIKVTNLKNGKYVIVKVNDRLHPKMKRIVDLSKTAAVRLGFVNKGLTRVKVEPYDKKMMPPNQ